MGCGGLNDRDCPRAFELRCLLWSEIGAPTVASVRRSWWRSYPDEWTEQDRPPEKTCSINAGICRKHLSPDITESRTQTSHLDGNAKSSREVTSGSTR